MNETDITEALVLAPDVGLVAVDELSLALRRQLAAQPGDHAVTRRLARDHSKLIGADAAALLEHFRHPITIVDAVIAFSDRRGIDPEQTLEQAFPLLQALLRSRFLVDARSPHASPVKSLFRVGEPFGDLTIVERVQCLDDTEVYKAVGSDGTMVALKVLRRPDDDALRAALEREVLVLAHFNDVAASGTVARGQGGRPDAGEGHRIVPRLVGAGNHHDLPYVQTEWVDGSSADAIAENLRSYRNIDTLFDVCLAIIDTYAQLHRLGIVHGDVHPGNIIVANSTAITLVDFGSASISGCDDRSQTPARQGVAQYFEPEFARSVLTGASNPRATFHSDQYALAAVLYLLLAGQHHLPLSTHKTAMLRQIAYEQPILDDELVVSSGLDTVLRRALATESDRRHSSTAEFGRAFRRAVGDSEDASEPHNGAEPRTRCTPSCSRRCNDYADRPLRTWRRRDVRWPWGQGEWRICSTAPPYIEKTRTCWRMPTSGAPPRPDPPSATTHLRVRRWALPRQPSARCPFCTASPVCQSCRRWLRARLAPTLGYGTPSARSSPTTARPPMTWTSSAGAPAASQRHVRCLNCSRRPIRGPAWRRCSTSAPTPIERSRHGSKPLRPWPFVKSIHRWGYHTAGRGFSMRACGGDGHARSTVTSQPSATLTVLCKPVWTSWRSAPCRRMAALPGNGAPDIQKC